ncbi:AraC family transcriptional regulator [Dyadobacter sp. 676]|uniref:AraC family transcriptional regulator n=1 Tax=Dyadobacter sp. 676 TaxID=3088362 RepID=A0AAU8FHK6_9BACT
MEEPLPSVVSLWNTSLSYITRNADIKDHRHYCFKVAVSLNHTVNCWISQSPYIGIRGFIVNQKKLHSCASPEGPVLNNLVEPESAWGRKLKELLGGQDFMTFEQAFDVGNLKSVLPANYTSLSNDALKWHIQRLMSLVTGNDQDHLVQIDVRVQRVLQLLDENLYVTIPRKQIQELTFLSFERCRHLFAQEMGIPMSRYILWQKLRRSLKDLVAGNGSLTDVSKKYGFADPSHFNRRFKQVFGVNPSTFLLECRLII